MIVTRTSFMGFPGPVMGVPSDRASAYDPDAAGVVAFEEDVSATVRDRAAWPHGSRHAERGTDARGGDRVCACQSEQTCSEHHDEAETPAGRRVQRRGWAYRSFAPCLQADYSAWWLADELLM